MGEPGGRETERVRRVYERFAARYDRSVRFWEWVLGIDEGRRWVCSQAKGTVLEVAIGTGRNLPYYAEGVRITGIDLSPAMLDVARRRASDLGRDVALHVGDASALEFADETFDTVVITLALCTIPDERRAVAQARRVLRPGGYLLLLEHVRSRNPLVRAGQRLVNPLFVRFQADDLLREPADHVRREGLVIERIERSRWGIMERVAARKPA